MVKRIAACMGALLLFLPVYGIFASVDDPEAAPESGEIFNVAMPLSLDFTIDPYELAGRGPVYSDGHMLENLGDHDVILAFVDIEVIFREGADIIPLPQPFDGPDDTEEKEIYLLLDFGRPDVQPLVLTAPPDEMPRIFLSATDDDFSFCILTISGDVTPYPAKEWMSSDVKIRITFIIESAQADSGFEDKDEPEPDEPEPDESEPDEPDEHTGSDGQESEALGGASLEDATAETPTPDGSEPEPPEDATQKSESDPEPESTMEPKQEPAEEPTPESGPNITDHLDKDGE